MNCTHKITSFPGPVFVSWRTLACVMRLSLEEKSAELPCTWLSQAKELARKSEHSLGGDDLHMLFHGIVIYCICPLSRMF